MFVNTLVYRGNVDLRRNFTDLQTQVKALCVSVMEHSAIPYDRLLRELHGTTTKARKSTNLFQLAINYITWEKREHKIGEATITPLID